MPLVKPTINDFIKQGVSCFVIGEEHVGETPSLTYIINFLKENIDNNSEAIEHYSFIGVAYESGISQLQSKIEKAKFKFKPTLIPLDNEFEGENNPAEKEIYRINDKYNSIIKEYSKDVTDPEKLKEICEYSASIRRLELQRIMNDRIYNDNKKFVNIIETMTGKLNWSKLEENKSLLFIGVGNTHIGMYENLEDNKYEIGLVRRLMHKGLTKIIGVTTSESNMTNGFLYMPEYKNMETEIAEMLLCI